MAVTATIFLPSFIFKVYGSSDSGIWVSKLQMSRLECIFLLLEEHTVLVYLTSWTTFMIHVSSFLEIYSIHPHPFPLSIDKRKSNGAKCFDSFSLLDELFFNLVSLHNN